MQLDVLREYVLLAKTLNYHAAAKELHISQPTLSNHISALEKELALSLIDRAHGIRLTEAGAVFLEWAAQTIAGYDETLERCRTVSKEERFSFSVQMSPLIDHMVTEFISCIQQFRESHPQACVNILPVSDKFVLDELQSGTCDCALYVEQATAPEIDAKYHGLATVPLCQDEAIAWMERDNPLTQKADLSLHDLVGSTIPIHVNNNARAWETAIENDFSVFGLKPTFSYRYAASSEEFILNQLRHDDVVLLPQGYLDTPLFKLRSDWVGVRFNPSVMVTCFVAYRNDEGKPALLEFASYIARRFRETLDQGDQPL